ncbi:DUF11 domain-containing protein [Blautia schinkii]|nr:DUF11 domain-containing protein [Blautia schinkii]
MKNRMINKVAGLGIMAFLLTTAIFGNWGQIPKVFAADVDNTGIKLTQKAVWTDENSCRAEITMEVSGLMNYKNAPPQPSAETMSTEDNVIDEFSGSEAEVIGDGETRTENDETDGIQIGAEGIDRSAVENFGFEEIECEELASGELASEELGAGEIGAGENIAGEIGAQGIEIEETEAGFEDFYRASVPDLLYLVNYISEYFQLDGQSPPAGCTVDTIPVHTQDGGQTVIEKVTYPIDLQNLTTDTISLRIPVILREEYRTPGDNVKYPVSQDAPLEKDRPGAGAFIELPADSGDGSSSQVLAQTASPLLEVLAVQADFVLELKASSSDVKAGETVNYELVVTNTGTAALSGIRLSPVFKQRDFTAVWEPADGLEIEGNQVLLTSLGKGEVRALALSVQLPEEAEGNLDLTVAAETFRPGATDELISREAALHIPVTALKVDFTVEKTADRTIAVPGDTITYQICIRNTGERTLHSVVSTERFLSAGVYAQFVEKAGVVLNGSRNQALISQIMPGEAFALEAVVTLPQNFTSQELINQVTVVAKETGSRSVQSQAGVTIQAPVPTVSPTPALYQSGAGTKSGGSLASKTSSYPKTGDSSRPGYLAAVMLGSSAAVAGLLRYRRGRRRRSC